MPANKPYPGENPATARKRIAANKATVSSGNQKKSNGKSVKIMRTKGGGEGTIMGGGTPKTKSDMLANNISSTIKNMGY